MRRSRSRKRRCARVCPEIAQTGADAIRVVLATGLIRDEISRRTRAKLNPLIRRTIGAEIGSGGFGRGLG